MTSFKLGSVPESGLVVRAVLRVNLPMGAVSMEAKYEQSLK